MRIERGPKRLLEVFLETTRGLTGDLDIQRSVLAVLRRSMELTEADYGVAVTRDARSEIHSVDFLGFTPEQVALLPRMSEGLGVVGHVIEGGETVRLEDLSVHPAALNFAPKDVPVSSFLGVALKDHGEVVGALAVAKKPEQPPFEEADETFLETMAAIATVGVINARLFAAEKERAERVALMSEISSKVRRTLDTNEVLRSTVEALGKGAEVDRCFIHLAGDDDDHELAEIQAEWDSPGTPNLTAAGDVRFPVSRLVMRTKQTQWTDDVMEDDRMTAPDIGADPMDMVKLGTRASLAAPLAWGDQLLGVVAFHSRTPRKWTEGEIALIEAAAREVSVALHHATLFSDAIETAAHLRHLDEMRSDFVAMVSHELRSPMTVVAGIADILKKRQAALSTRQRDELVDTLGREARRLTRLVSEVLDLEAIDQGGMELQLGQIDLAELAREAVTDAGVAERTELSVGRGNCVCEADGDRIKQVLLNLISNAAKFSGDNLPISVRVAPEGDGVSISVRDEGPGIDAKDHDKLFLRFSRLDSGRERKPGSGLGLYLSRSMVEAHGGTIWVDSEPGKGAKFSFNLPRKPNPHLKV